jgi:hypothetical protein
MMSHLTDAYPDRPGSRVPGPSEQAATAVTGMARPLRDQVLSTIANAPAGLTADEVATQLGKSILSIRARVAELHWQGEIRQSGTRGKNASGMSASVWILSPRLPKRGGQR